MKIYTVYLKPKEVDSVVLVPEGFSWAAFLPGYHIIWAILKRNWVFLFFLVAYYITGFAQTSLSGEWYIASTYIKTIILIFFGVWGNDIWRFSLKNQGFHIAGIVSGNNEDEALLRFLGEHQAQNYTNFHA